MAEGQNEKQIVQVCLTHLATDSGLPTVRKIVGGCHRKGHLEIGETKDMIVRAMTQENADVRTSGIVDGWIPGMPPCASHSTAAAVASNRVGNLSIRNRVAGMIISLRTSRRLKMQLTLSSSLDGVLSVRPSS